MRAGSAERPFPAVSLSPITPPTDALGDDSRPSHPAPAAAHMCGDTPESCIRPVGFDEQRHGQLSGVMATRAPAAGRELKPPLEQSQRVGRPAEAACFALRLMLPMPGDCIAQRVPTSKSR